MRHKLIVGVGLVAATCLAVFGAQRAKPTYSATAQILVTQQGFPLGRSALGDASNSSFADPARFDYLAQVYAELAATDVVRKAVLGKTGVQKGGLLVLDDGKTVGTYGVSAQTSDIGGSPMPFLAITAQAASAREATEIASRATAALRNYLERSQDDAGITGKARVELPVITKPTDPKLAQSRPLVMPLALFVLAVGATVGLVFFVENLRGGRRLVPVPVESDPDATPASYAATASKRSSAVVSAAAPDIGPGGPAGPHAPTVPVRTQREVLSTLGNHSGTGVRAADVGIPPTVADDAHAESMSQHSVRSIRRARGGKS